MAIPPQEIEAERALVAWSGDDAEREAAGPTPSVNVATLRIRQIELVGFKSFRDRTLLRFPSRTTGVVGPNGCGKSNVVDAIRWVLGEQSAKRLRGEGMEDVIFGGNDRHAPLGMAQVSIVFETDGLPLDQFALLKEGGSPLESTGPAEIMVTRRYFRSGESEYLMNGVTCRLRDITELFLGTGLGGKAYAIIEQGRVEALIGAKPEDLRLFIEEAAGTTLYRSRRQMAERKMERTRDNLARVQDILREVERQLASLRRQAKRAEQYKALMAEVAELDLALSSRARATHLAVIGDLAAQRETLARREAELATLLERLESDRRSARECEVEAQQRVRDAQATTFQARAALEASRNEVARLRAKVEELQAQEATIAADLDEAVAQRAAVAHERDGAAAQLRVLVESIEKAESEIAEKEAELTQTSGELLAAARFLDAARGALVESTAALADAQSSLGVSRERCAQQQARRERLEASARTFVEREAEAAGRASAAEQLVVEQQARLTRLEGAKRERAEQLRSVLSERASWEQAVDGLKDGLARAQSRRDSLRELQETRAGYTEGVRAVLAASSRDEALALVAEILEIPAEYERAVAAVLGEQIQAVVMRDPAAACNAVRALRLAGAGRVTCVTLAGPHVPLNHTADTLRSLLDLVRVRPGFEAVARSLLGNAYLVDDLDEALAVWGDGRRGWTLVTPAGETMSAAGAIAGGSERSEETLLAQRRELRTLGEEVERRETELGAARRRYDELTQIVGNREAALREVDSELGQVAVSVVGAEKDAQRMRQEIRELQEQARVVARELDEVDAQLTTRHAEVTRFEDERDEATRGRAAAETSVAEAERVVAERRAAADELGRAQTTRRIALADGHARRDALISTIERLSRMDDDTRRRATALQQRQQVDLITLEKTRAMLVEAAERIGEHEDATSAAEAALVTAESGLEAVRETTETVERQMGESQSEIDATRSRTAGLDLQVAEQRMALSHLEQNVRERYQRELAEVEPLASGPLGGDEAQLARLRERVASMGEVNVGALAEIAELEERQKFLGQQRDDLEHALDDLRRTIGRLNRASKARFRETFDQVNVTFQNVLPKLFGGGKGELRLLNEEQILDSGVEVVVQPPGKRIGPLDLLSGGEKALTAVSLIFSLFLTRPSPFCFLDEVDAPLDDANIGRFNDMVREMSAHSQFILITHNKRTMEVAETLYGVTMEEPGVSKVVSVRLPQ
ncbi:MAG: chromosome segregation protein SMC [Polyangiaceae bacterium UTPRO1]|nr:chromosome segregation protein SMC [Myxococcales bacterium]OQY66287.1 MAG: chromosome segregation protein SMC [Polyangiaceae bacterium UTPRO1]